MANYIRSVTDMTIFFLRNDNISEYEHKKATKEMNGLLRTIAQDFVNELRCGTSKPREAFIKKALKSYKLKLETNHD